MEISRLDDNCLVVKGSGSSVASLVYQDWRLEGYSGCTVGSCPRDGQLVIEQRTGDGELAELSLFFDGTATPVALANGGWDELDPESSPVLACSP